MVLSRGCPAWLGRQTHNLKRMVNNGQAMKDLLIAIFQSGKQLAYKSSGKTLMQNGSGINEDFEYIEFLKLFEDYLKGKVSDDVRYEYLRVAKKFIEKIKGQIDFAKSEETRQAISEFLDIENPNTYRNTLACLRHFFKFLASPEYLEGFKYKSVLPSFSIRTPSLEEIKIFGKAIKNKKVKVYYYLGVVSAIRPEHILRLYKSLFDKQNNMINTFQKTFSKKNFFFSFYTEEVKPMLEQYLDTLEKENSPLFPIGYRFVQDEFERATKRTGIKITPKTMRKFSTNWLRRHGMIPEDVDAISSHLPRSIVAKHYLDTSRIKEEYDKATRELKLLS